MIIRRIRRFVKREMGVFMAKQKIASRRFIVQRNISSILKKPNPEITELWKKWCEGREYQNGGDFQRFYTLILNITYLLDHNVPGAFAELGVYRGNSAAIYNNMAKKNNRKLYLYDTFQGFDDKDIKGVDGHRKKDFSDTSIEYVKRKVGDAEYRQGFFPDTIEDQDREESFAFVSLDCDLYGPTKAGLDFFYPRLSSGGIIICHDYSSGLWEGVTKAVDEFCEKNNPVVVLLADSDGSVIIKKS